MNFKILRGDKNDAPSTGADVIARKVLPFMAHRGRGTMITLGTWLAMNG